MFQLKVLIIKTPIFINRFTTCTIPLRKVATLYTKQTRRSKNKRKEIRLETDSAIKNKGWRGILRQVDVPNSKGETRDVAKVDVPES